MGSMAQHESGEPAGRLGRFEFAKRKALKGVSTTDLLQELVARFSADEPYPMSEDGVLAG